MKYHIVIGGLVIIAMFIAAAQSNEDEMILSNYRILAQQMKCLLDQGGCNDVGHRLKGVLREVITNKCIRCDKNRKNNAKKLMAFMKRMYPEELEQLLTIYSPKEISSTEIDVIVDEPVTDLTLNATQVQ